MLYWAEQIPGAVADLTITSKTKNRCPFSHQTILQNVFSSEFLSEFCTCVVEKIYYLCDMVFDDLVYDQQPCTWPALCPGMWERTVSL